MPMIVMGLVSGTQITPSRLFKSRNQTLKTPSNPDSYKLEPPPPRCKVKPSSSSSSLVHSRTPLQSMRPGVQRDSAMRNLVEGHDSEDDENGTGRKARQKSPNRKPAYTCPMILEVLGQFDDPQERMELFKGELQYLERWSAKTPEDEALTPDWMRQLGLAIRDEESAIQQRRTEHDSSRMTDTFAQSMTLNHPSGAQGRAAGPPAGRAAPTPVVRGICKGTRQPSTGPTDKRVLTWGDDGSGRLCTDLSRYVPTPGRPGRGSAPSGTPPPLPPRQIPACGTVVTDRPPPSSSDHIATATDQAATADEVRDPSSARFHANRGHAHGQAAGKMAVNANNNGGQTGAASPSDTKPLLKKNDQGGQDAGRKPARPSRPRRMTESVDEWMEPS